MQFDLYVPGDSWLHRLDPRAKLVLVTALLVAALVMRHVVFLAGLLLLTHGLLLSAGVPGGRLRWLWARMAPLTVFILLLQPLFAGDSGQVILSWGPLTITTGGVWEAVSFALRANAMAFAAAILLFVTDQQDLVRGLVRWGLPYDYGMTFSLALRYLPTTYGLWLSISDAQRVRGWTPERQHWWQRFRAYLPVLVAVMIGSLRFSDELGLALAARGFGARTPRSIWHEVRFTPADWTVCAVVALLLTAVLWVRLAGGWGAAPL
jgi:energy-coupling factor transport system permease protein